MDGFDDRASVSTLFSASTMMAPTTPVLPPLEMLEPVLPRFEQSFTHDSRVTSPPFSYTVLPSTHKTGASGETSKSTPRAERNVRRKEREFRQRRMRAAKLSNFFGVGYHDLEPHLVPEGDRAEVQKVEVAIDDRGMLPWDRHEFRSLEMEDVIVRLRDLRSS